MEDQQCTLDSTSCASSTESTAEFLLEGQVPLPNHPTFDYWQHEYWRLGQAYQTLVEWQQSLEQREAALEAASHRYPRNNNYRGENINTLKEEEDSSNKNLFE